MSFDIKSTISGMRSAFEFMGVLALYGALLGIAFGICAAVAYAIFKVLT
jgi:hypothetical protein